MGSLKLDNIHKSFGTVEVLKGIDLEVNDGEFIIFVGPSGCGKSTLLRIIAGLEDASAGSVKIDDEIVNHKPPSNRGIAMVFQTYALYPHLSVRDNMGLGLKQAKRPKAEIAERVNAASKMLSLDPLLERGRRNCQVASANVLPSVVPSCANPHCFCSTNRFQTSMPLCASTRALRSHVSTASSVPPWSM